MKRIFLLLIPLMLAACGQKPNVDPFDGKTTAMKQNYKDYSKKTVFNNCASMPVKGNIKLLIIPVWFTDSGNYIKSDDNKANVREDITKAYVGTNEEVGYRSVKTYYEEESSNKLSISATVTNWYITGKGSVNYKEDDDFGSKTSALLQSAVTWAETNEGVNRSDYDSDKDGYMDGVVLIYARPDCATLEGSKNNFWAYCAHDQDEKPSFLKPAANVYFWASYDFMYQNEDSYTYQRTGTRYGYGHTYRQILDTETYIHETGHMFGLFDYYDTTNYNFIPAGRYTMQDENVSMHDPFSYIALNWADPYIPTGSCTITIGDFATTHDVILLTPKWNSYDSPFDEYILLELYSLTGLNEHYKGDKFHDINLPDAVGIRVWHVDARLISFNLSTGYEKITTNVNDGNVYKLTDNSHALITDFPDEQRGSFLCANQNMLQLISHTTTRNYGALQSSSSSNHFISNDLFMEGDSFSLDTYKRQFINIDTGKFYGNADNNIRLNNRKKLNWSFTVSDITTVDGASTATITLNKLA